jgi:predicted small lipoprotein YifL
VPGSNETPRALTRRRALLGLLVLALAAGCGRRGDLYMPPGEAADEAEEERRAREAHGG